MIKQSFFGLPGQYGRRVTKANRRDPFYKLQTGPTGESGPPERWTIFSESFPVGLSIVPKFLEISVEWITPNTSSHSQGNSQLIHKGKMDKMPKIQIPKIINNMDL